MGSDPRSEPVPMTRSCAAPDQAHIWSPLVAAAPISRIRRVGLRRPGPFFRSAVEANDRSGSRDRCRGSAAFSPSTRPGVRSGGSRPYCGCAKGSGLRARGRCASRTGCCRSVSVSRRLIKPETRAVLAYRAAYARICDKPPTRYRGSAKSGPSNPTKELEVSSRFRLKRSQSKLRGSSGDRSTGFTSPCPTILVRGIFQR